MKIKVVNAMAPFIWGGAEELAHHLVRNLRFAGHDAELLRIPFNWDPFEEIPTEIGRLRTLEIKGADRVISMKFPIYLLQAERHTTWLIHQYRQAYDLWGTPFGNLPDTPEGRAIRDLIVSLDTEALQSRERLFTISDEVSDRLRRFNNIEAPALILPLNDPEIFTGGASGDYILAPGRVNNVKRQWLAIEAIRHVPGAKLIVAGPPETPDDAKRLEQLVEEHDLSDRVLLDLRFLDRRKLAEYVNGCRAVVYLPYHEDAYGYVTMEAFEAAKPVITVDDAGAVSQFVRDGATGQIAPPEPQAIGRAMDLYLSNRKVAREHGATAREDWRLRGVTWPKVIQQLIGE